MGISTNIYTVFGVKIPWDDAFSDAYEEAYEKDSVSLPNVISDGMSGEYMILGEQLFDSGDFRWGLEDGDIYKENDLLEMLEAEQKYRKKFKETFPNFYHLIDKPFKVISFTHFS